MRQCRVTDRMLMGADGGNLVASGTLSVRSARGETNAFPKIGRYGHHDNALPRHGRRHHEPRRSIGPLVADRLDEHSARGPTATLLPDGRVLVTGGHDGTGAWAARKSTIRRSGTWSPTAAMSTARSGHTATLLTDGRVLVSGGGIPRRLQLVGQRGNLRSGAGHLVDDGLDACEPL